MLLGRIPKSALHRSDIVGAHSPILRMTVSPGGPIGRISSKGKGVQQHPQGISESIGPTKPNRRHLVLLAQEERYWRPPNMSRFKLNIDAAWTADSAGVGGLIMDHFGRMRFSFTIALASSHSPKHVEMIAIVEGFRMAERFGYTNYTLESDCKGVIDQLRARLGFLSSLGHIHQRILDLVDRQSIVLSFVRRDTNILAHLLAAHTVSTYLSNV